jgi:cytochrome c-type biogenesis protein CcsB
MTFAFNLSLAGYLTALLFSTASLFSKKGWFASSATVFLAMGVAVQTVYMAARWYSAGRAPFSNMFESMVLFAWAMVVVYLALRIRIRIPVLGAATALLAVVTLAYASTYETKIQPLMPALRSNWLTFHVFTAFLGYGGFAIAALTGVGYLIASRNGSRVQVETTAALDAATAKTIAFGFLFLTVGIITGAVWANSAWGTYWSWDPKETWSLITWFIYAVFLHCRFMRGWKGKRAAWISILGFASVIFTYYGVNFLLSGYHSYARS